MNTRILLVGFGNIGRNILGVISQYPDLEVIGIVTRRPERVKKEIGDISYQCLVYSLNEPETYIGCKADVAIMCGGSKDDLPEQTPFFAKHFNVVDSFDTHAHIGSYIEEKTEQLVSGHLETVNNICLVNNHTGCVGVGWDPGAFSLMRTFFKACLGNCKVYAFYGLTPRGGLSMGHSNAIRNIPGVIDARQYTHARQSAIDQIHNGKTPDFTDSEKHWRECNVVVADGADKEQIKKMIVDMPDYFAPYETTVEFVSQGGLDIEKKDFSHDGLVIATGSAGYMEFKNVWNSNPMGTAGFLLAYARAVYRMDKIGQHGCFVTPNIPVSYLLQDESDGIALV